MGPDPLWTMAGRAAPARATMAVDDWQTGKDSWKAVAVSAAPTHRAFHKRLYPCHLAQGLWKAAFFGVGLPSMPPFYLGKYPVTNPALLMLPDRMM